MLRSAEKCREHNEKFTKFKELSNDLLTDGISPYNRYLDIEELSARYEAMIGSVAEDRHFVRSTYKYSISPSIRPQNKKKQEESPPDEINEDETELCKNSRQDWLRFLKGFFSCFM